MVPPEPGDIVRVRGWRGRFRLLSIREEADAKVAWLWDLTKGQYRAARLGDVTLARRGRRGTSSDLS